MGSRAEDDRDYDVVKVKVKKRDKDGNDITGDEVGTGGRRREDGTLSAMYYDPEPLDDTQVTPDREALEAQLLDYALAEQRMKQERTQETIDLVFYGLNRLLEFLADNPEVALKIKDGACAFGRNIAGGVKSITAKLTLKKGAAPSGFLPLPFRRRKRGTGFYDPAPRFPPLHSNGKTVCTGAAAAGRFCGGSASAPRPPPKNRIRANA